MMVESTLSMFKAYVFEQIPLTHSTRQETFLAPAVFERTEKTEPLGLPILRNYQF